jgi:DNA invertase Pin-like site-specific DNA recombinase
MLHYYINPKTCDLVIFDTNSHELFITERVTKVQVMTTMDFLHGSPAEDENGMPRSREAKSWSNARKKGSRSRWTPQEINKVIDRKEAGERAKAIADGYGVTEAAIYQILKKGRQEIDDTRDLVGEEIE